MIMFEKFGEFTSFEEINKKAAELKAAGDKDSLLKLCDENGLDHEDAEDFMDGVIEELTTLKLAAIGKITVEKADLKTKGVVNDWTDIIIQMNVIDLKNQVIFRGTGNTEYITSDAAVIAKPAQIFRRNPQFVKYRPAILLSGSIHSGLKCARTFSSGVFLQPTRSRRINTSMQIRFICKHLSFCP